MPAPGEEAWTEDDVEYALAWQELDKGDCDGCGHPRSESFDPANERSYEVKALVCHACSTREEKAKAFQESGGRTEGLFFSVSKVRGDQ